MIPPSFMTVRIVENGKSKIRFWFPLILLWPFLGLFFLLLLPVFFVWGIVGNHQTIELLKASYELVCAATGLKVEVENNRSYIKIAIK